MDYLFILLFTALPAIIGAILMKPNIMRYLVISLVTGFVIAAVSIDIPTFIRDFKEIFNAEGALMSWAVWFVAFFIPPAAVSFLAQLVIGGVKNLTRAKREIQDSSVERRR